MPRFSIRGEKGHQWLKRAELLEDEKEEAVLTITFNEAPRAEEKKGKFLQWQGVPGITVLCTGEKTIQFRGKANIIDQIIAEANFPQWVRDDTPVKDSSRVL